mgnify:FL=1|tara:strand:+ start:927 stop:1748 length:822 start_codon:yes stop_codon:yes gene_type:complete
MGAAGLQLIIVKPEDFHVVVSGGFDPIHLGHLNLINDAATLGKVIVIANSDNFLLRKKGFFLMPFIERVEIIKNLKNVDSVFLSIDDDDSVSESIKALSSDKSLNIKYFANGGDRSNQLDIPEYQICKENNIELVFDIGGGKTQSSSSLFNDAKETLNSYKNSVNKPWGSYINLLEGSNFLVKKILVKVNEEISYQSHCFRDEHWILVEGNLEVINGNSTRTLEANDYEFIKRNAKHRIKNIGAITAVMIEVQFGDKIDEKDIKRYDDKYGRS